MVNLGSFYARAGRCVEHAAFLDETVRICRAHSPPDTPNLGLALRNVAQCHVALKRPVEAERAFLEAEAQLASVLPPNNSMLQALHGAMADFYAEIGWTAEAAAWKLKAEPPP
jgi:hypothetical protein